MRVLVQITLLMVLLSVFTSCKKGHWQKVKDERLSYRSIIDRTGNVYVNRAGTSIVYEGYVIKYSDSDATTLLIESPNGDEVYIQGAAVIEFTDEEVSGD